MILTALIPSSWAIVPLAESEKQIKAVRAGKGGGMLIIYPEPRGGGGNKVIMVNVCESCLIYG